MADNPIVRAKRFGMPSEAKAVRYPLRLLRYWFGYQLLREDCLRVGHPLSVAEIGVHRGQMLEFVKSAPPGVSWSKWTAVDAVMLTGKLKKAGYEDFYEANIEDRSFALPGTYDCAILLHVLEHLFEPEEALKKIASGIAPGGSLIGGFPVVPGVLASLREKQVRRNAGPMGHVSVFSPSRVRRMAQEVGLVAEFCSGAFFLRSKGSSLENSAAWMRFNLAWGRLFPGWPGEIYWLMRKPA
ncbi:MAG: class I SAM-dependent methyltransferase [Terrimicrobiaceae bacterium]|nr:class I SAM-dependent methyltransferase [Terrimicrobiaceae bacterium]